MRVQARRLGLLALTLALPSVALGLRWAAAPTRLSSAASHRALSSLRGSSTALAAEVAATEAAAPGAIAAPSPRARFLSANLAKRWATGLSLGALCTLWIFSGNGVFTLLFLLVSLVAQTEYYQMVQHTHNILPTKKIGMVSLIMAYTTAAMFPQFHEAVMPLSATFLMLWLLVFNKKSPLISEISTSLLGMFYIGYLPSFWVRLKTDAALSALSLPPLALSAAATAAAAAGSVAGAGAGAGVSAGRVPSLALRLAAQWPWAARDVGSILTWWTWTSIVFADVGAYFVGKRFGRHKLGEMSRAAGAASPNKTIEGALGGFASCMLFAVAGAKFMRWPSPLLTGSAYGLMISVIALVGDLTASMMKRDAGMKDSGNLLPGHGGLLDRIDSYMFTAPAAYYFCTWLLPWMLRAQHSGAVPPLL